ncbi:Peptide-N(4)-(N-acetyl-beta-glucosaminyl)asparagine amidase [Capsicum annuum]|nr:Peptide-N(4)-(N-acetyl-beta-glucosaminyl)asparagine amidase [Capsicum annuum]
MVARKFAVSHNSSTFDVDYDTDDGFEVLKYQLFSLTSVPPDQQKDTSHLPPAAAADSILFVENPIDDKILGRDDQIVSDESDLASISDKLRLVSIDGVEEAIAVEEKGKSEILAMSDEEFARLLQAEEEALMMQHFVSSENKEQVEQRIRPYVNQVQMYEDPHRQEMARKTVPVDKLEEKALISLGREGNYKPTKVEQDNAFLLQLLFWFKQSFRWVNAPPCDSCGNETRNQGMGVANPSETLYGASRVELYWCNSCSNITRFPRYNDPLKRRERGGAGSGPTASHSIVGLLVMILAWFLCKLMSIRHHCIMLLLERNNLPWPHRHVFPYGAFFVVFTKGLVLLLDLTYVVGLQHFGRKSAVL